MFLVELQWGSKEGRNRLPLYAQIPAVPAKGTHVLLLEFAPDDWDRENPIEFEVEVESVALDLENPEGGAYILYLIPTE